MSQATGNPKDTSRFDGTAGVFFTTHSSVDTREWDLISEFGNAYHPLSGFYRSDDPAVLHQQLQWMRRAGIDLIVCDVFPTLKLSLLDLPRDTTLPLLMKELANQQDEPRQLQLCFYLEKYLGNPTLEEYEFALEFIRDQVSEHDYYYRYHDKPLVLTYLNGEHRVVHELEFRNTHFSLRRVRPFYSDVWSYCQYYPQLRHQEWMPVSPGIDAYLELAYVAKYVNKVPTPDFEEIRRTAPRVEREDGAEYRRQLAWVKQANPEIIFVSGWNDWQYGTQIEPAVEYECQYLDITAEELGRWNETAPYRQPAGRR